MRTRTAPRSARGNTGNRLWYLDRLQFDVFLAAAMTGAFTPTCAIHQNPPGAIDQVSAKGNPADRLKGLVEMAKNLSLKDHQAHSRGNPTAPEGCAYAVSKAAGGMFSCRAPTGSMGSRGTAME